MKKRILIRGTTVVIGLAAFSFVFPIHSEVTRVCFNTTSVISYDKWFFFIRINNEYRESLIEAYMKKNHPNELKYDWHTVGIIPRNIEGRRLIYVCMPAMPFTTMRLTHESSHQAIAELPDEQKYELYKILSDKSKSESELDDLIKISGDRITIKSSNSFPDNMPQSRTAD
ncbi:MAG: hypothetical protein LBV12_05620 [Puniceicoccales bacterium]|jgi:hypothetical protein|nr:hypothetical protein [Puniceicoccales bacterium]